MMDGLTVGRIASATGITPDAVRYYERLRLLAPARRTAAGYRAFDPSEVDRIHIIRRAQTLGLSLAEIRALFPLGALGRIECTHVRRLLEGKIAQTDARILELKRFKSELAAYLKACNAAIAHGSEATCPLFTPGVAVRRRRLNAVRA